MLPGAPGGTVDLATGRLRPARPADHMIKLAGYALGHGEPTLWLRFLAEALGGDQEAIRFLKRWIDYRLTGDTRARRRRGRKRAMGMRAPMTVPQGPDQRWSLDAVGDALISGRRIRILAVVDEFKLASLANSTPSSRSGACRRG